jgi:hypothetical protein
MPLDWHDNAQASTTSTPLQPSDEGEAAMESPNVSRELIAFRFLVLVWIGALLILAYGVYAHVEAARSQGDVTMFSNEISLCRKEASGRTPACRQSDAQSQRACREQTDPCSDRSTPGWGQGLDASIAYRDDMVRQAENAPWVALTVFLCVTAIFYAVRWALTGRLRPLWLLKRRNG